MPIKRDAALVPLSSEHHRALLLAFQCKQAASGRALAGAGRTPRLQVGLVEHAFAEVMDGHFRAEEELLAPLLAPHLPQGEELVRLRADHEELRRLRGALREGPDEALPALLGAFAQKLEAHVRWEERELFAVAERVLTAEEKRKLEEALPTRLSAAACAVRR